MAKKDSVKETNRNELFVTFLSASGRLKTIKRSGWLKKVGIVEDCESVADHSFRTAILGLCLSEQSGLDSGKVVRMCLIHDLAEAYIGDLMPEEKSSEKEHRSKEDEVMRKLLFSLPNRSRYRLTSDWKELVAKKSKEAKLVWQLDKLEMGLQQKEYVKMGFNQKKLREFNPRTLLSRNLQQLLDGYAPQ